jgi:hypothetical protein
MLSEEIDMSTQPIAVSPTRLLFLRAVYLLIALAMGAQVWPQIVTQSGNWVGAAGSVKAMLGALTILCLWGLRYPLKMLPILFWEMAFKTIWLSVVALPAWLTQTMDANIAENTFACSLVVLVYAATPWRYVFQEFAKVGGDPWKAKPPRTASPN